MKQALRITYTAGEQLCRIAKQHNVQSWENHFILRIRMQWQVVAAEPHFQYTQGFRLESDIMFPMESAVNIAGWISLYGQSFVYQMDEQM